MADAIVPQYNSQNYTAWHWVNLPYVGTGMLSTFPAEYCCNSSGHTVFIGTADGSAVNANGSACVVVVDTRAARDPTLWTVVEVLQLPQLQIFARFEASQYYPPIVVDREERKFWITARTQDGSGYEWHILDVDSLTLTKKEFVHGCGAVYSASIGARHMAVSQYVVDKVTGETKAYAAFGGMNVTPGYIAAYGNIIDKESGLLIAVWYKNPVSPWIATLMSVDIEHTTVVATNEVYNNATVWVEVKLVQNSLAGNSWAFVSGGSIWSLTNGVTLSAPIATMSTTGSQLYDVPEMRFMVDSNGWAYDAITGTYVTSVDTFWPRTPDQGRDVIVTERLNFDSFGSLIGKSMAAYFSATLSPLANGITSVQSTTAVCVVPTEDSTVASSQVQALDAPFVGTYAIRATCGQKCSTTGTIDIGITSAQSMQGQSVQARTWLFSGGV